MEHDSPHLVSPVPASDRARGASAIKLGCVRPPTLLSIPSYLAGNVARVGTRILRQVLKQHGLRLSHHAVLIALRDFGPLAQYELADRLDVDRSQVVGFVDRLEHMGMVTRARDARDRRKVLVSLTAEGERIERQITHAARSSQATLLGALSPAERAELLRLLQLVLDAHDEARLKLTVS